MKFEWDVAKSEKTLAKRGFDFDFAAQVFLDENRIGAPAKTVKGEERFAVIGLGPEGVPLHVVYTWRTYENEKFCRIISAREASRKERRRYSALR